MEERFDPRTLAEPVVQAPLAGGPSTPALAAAVSGAGGLGFVAAGYRSVEQLAADLAAVRGATQAPFGVNVFVPSSAPAPAAVVDRFAATLQAEAARRGVAPGDPRFEDDAWEDKLGLLAADAAAVVSFTFGCPPADIVTALQEAGSAVWVTVTTPGEAVIAARAGADALIVQGVEAGGHRGSFDDAAPGEIALLPLLALVRDAVGVPLVATGGIATGAGVAAVLAGGAAAAQLGTAFLRVPEAGTVPAHRDALTADRPTLLTRAFTGRTARGLANRFALDHPDAPRAYPELHHLTAPLRAAARAAGDAEGFNLWAGQAHRLATVEPAADLVRRLGTEARAALRDAAARWA